jgi:hypothetical protein
MGLKVSTIARLPISTDRDYFIYFLDYGWDEPLSQAMYANFDRLAQVASENRGLIISGLNRQEFANEVLSWHGINGESAKEILPAIMITDTEPRVIADSNEAFNRRHAINSSRSPIEKMILIPLKKACKTPTDVTELLSKISHDMQNRKSILDFEVKEFIDKSNQGFAEMVILKPSVAGVGIDLIKAFQFGKKYWNGMKAAKPRS